MLLGVKKKKRKPYHVIVIIAMTLIAFESGKVYYTIDKGNSLLPAKS